MQLQKLFRILVLGGATAGAATGCGTANQQTRSTDPKPTATQDPNQQGGPANSPPPPTSGGGATGW